MKRNLLILRFVITLIIAFVAGFYAVNDVSDYKFGIMIGTSLGVSFYEMLLNLIPEEKKEEK